MSGDSVVRVGLIGAGDIGVLRARALLRTPSLALTAVTPAACGAPMVATTASPLPGILEGGGFFVESGDVGALTAALRRLATDSTESDRLGRRAHERVAKLSWDHAAEVVLRALNEAAAG